jgi:DNA polymerase elongation subunit (family B)
MISTVTDFTTMQEGFESHSPRSKEVYEFKIIYGDTDSLFVTDVKKENDVMKFIAECSTYPTLGISLLT